MVLKQHLANTSNPPLINSKNCENISHVKVPTDLLEPSKKRKEQETYTKRKDVSSARREEGPSSKKNNVGRVVHPYSTDLKEFFKQPLQDAGNPGLSRICGYCVFTRKQLLPDLTARDCEQFLVLGKCMFGTKCKFDHRTANKKPFTSNGSRTTHWD